MLCCTPGDKWYSRYMVFIVHGTSWYGMLQLLLVCVVVGGEQMVAFLLQMVFLFASTCRSVFIVLSVDLFVGRRCFIVLFARCSAVLLPCLLLLCWYMVHLECFCCYHYLGWYMVYAVPAYLPCGR